MCHDDPRKLHELLVQEFRLWQALVSLTGLERRLLVECDVPLLVDLARRKGAVLAELTAAQQVRRQWIETCSAPGTQATETQIYLESLEPDETESLSHLVEGIRLLASQIGEQAQANYALADCAVKRLWALNGWLQQENRTSLPTLLASFVGVQPESEAGYPFFAPLEFPLPAWSQPLELLDQDFFALPGAVRVARSAGVS